MITQLGEFLALRQPRTAPEKKHGGFLVPSLISIITNKRHTLLSYNQRFPHDVSFHVVGVFDPYHLKRDSEPALVEQTTDGAAAGLG